ncbi:TadE/TadG family type IV pilus assembly protein [Rugamonas sp.]|uniref:TadE/TadG family type IV pilus assembly protein n=1 Tax=Rugamonas sp. TaxID=1926287 RepID=UPI0025FB03BD|nr:TadE family protein [Rugamonas sp.]
MTGGFRAAVAARASAGLAAVEFAILLPFMLFLILATSDFARGIQANMIMINISREAANLAARGKVDLSTNSQVILDSVAATAPPLDMDHRGMVYITKLMGYTDTGSGAKRTIVLEQYRWDDAATNQGFRVSGYAPSSKLWNCASWNNSTGACNNIPTGNTAPAVPLMSGNLIDGEVIYVAESFYQFNLLFGNMKLGNMTVPVFGTNLYSQTVF